MIPNVSPDSNASGCPGVNSSVDPNVKPSKNPVASPGATATARILGADISCDLPLPQLPGPRGLHPEIIIERSCLEPDDPDIQRHFQRDSRQQSAPTWRVEVSPDGLVLKARGLAAFYIAAEAGQIRYDRHPTATDAALASALTDQVLPRALAMRGHLVLHAACVAIGAVGVCFMGPSRSGKSTLAAACQAAGWAALCDDTVLIERRGSRLHCIPAYPGIRLWQDSALLFAPDPSQRQPVHEATAKQRCSISPQHPGAGKPLPLAAILVLERTASASSVDAVATMLRLPWGAATASISEQTMILSRFNHAHRRRMLQCAAEVAAAVPVYRLRYAAGFQRLPEVCAAIAQALIGKQCD